MELYDKVLHAATYISSKIDATDAIAITLGSGLGPMSKIIENPVEISYKDIPYFLESTAPGHAGKLIYGTINGKKVLCMSGRWHRYEGYDFKDLTLYVRVFKMIGCKTLILTNACGGVNRSFHPGTLMLVDDFINFMSYNPLVGPNDDRLGPRFPDMVNALSKELKDIAINAAEKLNIELAKGVYMAFTGPNFETPAEIRLAATLGADAVGMSSVPEILVARHANLPCMCISLISNMAAGITGQELSSEEVNEEAGKASEKFQKLIIEIINNI